MKKILIVLFAVALPFVMMAQKKKVAIVTFYVNKYIEPSSDLAGSAQLLGSIASLSKDPNFNLTSILEKFHTTFMGSYISDFPFELVDEKTVLENEEYKKLRSLDTTSIFYRNCLLSKDYRFLDVSVLYHADLKKLAAIFPDVDGFMFVFLSYSIVPKLAFGGLGTAAISAGVTLKLWNKNGDKVFNISEGEFSKETVPLVAGIPVMKVDKILPMCTSATDNILVELKKRLPKIVKKVGKNL
jgi:hypothetical protein